MSTRARTESPLSSRRGLLIAGAVGTIGGAFAIRGALGHATTKDARTLSGTGVARAGGELIVAFDGAAVATFALDPQNSGFAPHNRVMRSIYDSLTHLRPDQSVGPWLAESWTVSSDLKSFEFKLRRGVKFHDGTPFDAAALK